MGTKVHELFKHASVWRLFFLLLISNSIRTIAVVLVLIFNFSIFVALINIVTIPMSVEIKEVKTKKELRSFVKFNIKLYKDCPYHVPNLIDEEIMTLSEDKNPAFEHCEAIYFLAYKNGKIVGRIADHCT